MKESQFYLKLEGICIKLFQYKNLRINSNIFRLKEFNSFAFIIDFAESAFSFSSVLRNNVISEHVATCLLLEVLINLRLKRSFTLAMPEKAASNVCSPWHTMLCNSKQHGNRRLIVSWRYITFGSKGLNLWQVSTNRDYWLWIFLFIKVFITVCKWVKQRITTFIRKRVKTLILIASVHPLS